MNEQQYHEKANEDEKAVEKLFIREKNQERLCWFSSRQANLELENENNSEIRMLKKLERSL